MKEITNENEVVTNETEEQVEQFKIKGLDEAIELTKENEEKIREYVDDFYKQIVDIITNTEKDFNELDAFSTMSKVMVYLTQNFFKNKEEFDEEYKIARKLTTENIIQSLGINATDEELNKNSIVTFNGTPDAENYSLRRIIMIASQLVEYAIWQLTLSDTFKKMAEEEVN